MSIPRREMPDESHTNELVEWWIGAEGLETHEEHRNMMFAHSDLLDPLFIPAQTNPCMLTTHATVLCFISAELFLFSGSYVWIHRRSAACCSRISMKNSASTGDEADWDVKSFWCLNKMFGKGNCSKSKLVWTFKQHVFMCSSYYSTKYGTSWSALCKVK